MGQKQPKITTRRNDIVIEFLEIYASVDISILTPIKDQIEKRVRHLKGRIKKSDDRPHIVQVRSINSQRNNDSAKGISLSATCPYSFNGILSNIRHRDHQASKTEQTKMAPGYDNLILEKDIHQEFLNSLENSHSSGVGNFKRLSLEITFTVFKENRKFHFEISDKDNTYEFEIDNGYSKYIATYDGYFNLFVAARFFRFDAKGNLKGFDAVFEILYPWPVLSVKTGQVLYKSKKVDGPVLHVQIDKS